jgi:ATP-binding cassette subfamily C protein LapB
MNGANQGGFIDTLLECLVFIAKTKGTPFSAETLTAGLPLSQHRLTPQIFPRAAERAGLRARVVQRPLHKIHRLLLPAILILKNSEACLLLSCDPVNDRCEIMNPEAGESSQQCSYQALEEMYGGYAIFVQSAYNFHHTKNDTLIKQRNDHWFWGTLWQYKSYYYQVAAAALFVNIFAVVTSLYSMNIYDRVLPNNAFDTLWVLSIGVLIVLIFDLILRSLRHYLISISAQKADTILASQIFRQILNLRMTVKPNSAGAFANSIHSYEALRDFFTSATVATLVDIPFALLFLVMIYAIGSWLVCVTLVAIPATLLASYLCELPTRKAIQRAHIANTRKHGLLIETLSNLETVKTQSGESRLQSLWEQCVGISSKANLHAQHYAGLASHLINFVTQINSVCNVILGVYLISEGHISMGALIACNFLSMRVLVPLSQISSMVTRYQKSKIGLEALDKIMAHPVERPDNVRFLHRPQFKGRINFLNVSFSYPNQSLHALNQVSFQINAGERVGIIGRIGSGKSTIFKLLLNLYPVEKGSSIRLDETDLSQIDPAQLRRNIGYIAQDLSLFAGTVRDNITMTVPWASDASILRAAQLSGVETFIQKHPLGYDMPIGERGEGISSGQRQAIMLARALLADPPILLFDEPTSHMDNTSEQLFMRHCQMILPEKTLLLITHKSSMLALVDRVIVIDEGRIIADGPKEKVLASFLQTKGKA